MRAPSLFASSLRGLRGLRGLLTLLLCAAPLASLSPLCASHASAAPVTGFDGPGEPVSAALLRPALSDEEGYGEKYTFDADLGEGDSFYFSMQITNLGSGDHKMTARGAVSVGGVNHSWVFKRDKGKWRSEAGLSVKAGGAHLSGTPEELRFRVTKGDLKVDFTFRPLAPTWQPPGGGLRLGGHHTVYQVFPLSRVEGTLQLPGAAPDAPPLSRLGKGWGTHTRSTLGPHEQSLWTTQLRAIDLSSDTTLYLRELFTTEDYGKRRLSYALVTKGEEVLFEGFNFTPTVTKTFTDTRHENRYKVAEDFSVDIPDVRRPGVRLTGSFRSLKRTHHKNPIANESWLVRKVIERFSQPMEYAYQMRYDVKLVGPNITAGGDDAKLEVYHFND